MQKVGMVACGLVLLVAAWVILHDLRQTPLEQHDEGTYAQVVQESIERQDFLTFTLNSGNWFEKPPLYFWLAGAATYVTGSEVLGIRLPAALFGIAAVALTMLLAWQGTKSYWVSALAGTLLVATEPFVQGAREARLDVLVAFFILLAFWAAFERRYMLFAVAAALAALSKSVIGIFAFIPLLFVLPAISTLYVPAAVFAAIVLPWHLYEWALWGREFVAQYVGYHLLARYESNIFGSPDLQTDYVHRLAEQAKLIFTVFVLAVVSIPLYIDTLVGEERRYLWAILATVAAMTIVFFTAQTRALSYLIPLYPFAALLVSLSLWHTKGVIR